METMLLTCIRRDLTSTLVPELRTERAKNIASIMDILLGHVISRRNSPYSRQDYIERVWEAIEKLGQHSAASDEAAFTRTRMQESDFGERIHRAVAMALERHRVPVSAGVTALSSMVQAELDYRSRDVAQTAVLDAGADGKPHQASPFTPEQLSAYLRDRFPERRLNVVSVISTQGGFSKDVFIAQCDEGALRERIVIRCDRPNGPIGTSVSGEYALLAALYRQGLQVPEPLWAEEAADRLGSPFLAMRWVPGRPVTMGSLSLPATEESLTACRWMAQFLARLHGIDVATSPLASDERIAAVDHVRRYIEHWKRVWKSRRMEPSVIVTAGFEWLLNNIPQDEQPPVLVHGDAGFHNVMADGGRVTAMLDWECAHVGHPGEDLGACRVWVETVMDWQDFFKQYRKCGGCGEDHSNFFTVLYLVRCAVITGAVGADFANGALHDLKASFSGIHLYPLSLQLLAKALVRVGCLHDFV